MNKAKTNTSNLPRSLPLAVALVCAGAFSSQQAGAQDGNTACEAVMCLGGMMMSTGTSSDCNKSIAKYFSIVKFHNGFSPGRTASARASFLNRCPTKDDDGIAQKVNDKYGRIQFSPF